MRASDPAACPFLCGMATNAVCVAVCAIGLAFTDDLSFGLAAAVNVAAIALSIAVNFPAPWPFPQAASNLRGAA